MSREPGFDKAANIYVTGVGEIVRKIHPEKNECHWFGCVIHSPTEHTMSHMPTHWRNDRNLMERICEHGVGHPDPDHMNWYLRTYGKEAAQTERIHGCCHEGCCYDDGEWDKVLAQWDEAHPEVIWTAVKKIPQNSLTT